MKTFKDWFIENNFSHEFQLNLRKSNERIHTSDHKLNDKSKRIIGDSSGSVLGVGGKPKGLWYGFGDSWIYFTQVDYTGVVGHKYIYKIYPNFQKIIVLKTFKDVMEFTKNYLINKFIDWNKVAKNYSGIELPFYNSLGMRLWGSHYSNDIEGIMQDELKGDIDYHRLSHTDKKNLFSWLYNWDVDSGCIWSPAGLLRYEEISYAKP